MDKFRFEFKEDLHYVKYWVIQKQFLWFFWLNYKKIPYRLLEDGYPNINQVMDYVDWLNLEPNEYDDYSPDDLINVRKYKDEKEAHIRINKIISIVKKSLNDKSLEIEKTYQDYVKSGISRKDYALSQRKGNPNFGFVMGMVKADDMRKMSKEEILKNYDNMEQYEKSLQRCEPYEMAKLWLRDLTKRLNLSREWLQTKDKTLFFQDPEESDDDN